MTARRVYWSGDTKTYDGDSKILNRHNETVDEKHPDFYVKNKVGLRQRRQYAGSAQQHDNNMSTVYKCGMFVARSPNEKAGNSQTKREDKVREDE